MYKITYNRVGQKSKCTYETTKNYLFNKYLEELKNDKSVSNIETYIPKKQGLETIKFCIKLIFYQKLLT